MSDNGFDKGTVALLKDLQTVEPSDLTTDLVKRTETGEFHDYYSPHAAPKVLLAQILMDKGLDKLVERCCCGQYNQDYQEALKWFKSQGNSPFKRL